MKIVLGLASFLFVTFLAVSAFALPPCSSNFCTASSSAANGSQCGLNGKTYTCGKYSSHSGAASASLYEGSLSGAQSKTKCEEQYGQTPTTTKKKEAVKTRRN